MEREIGEAFEYDDVVLKVAEAEYGKCKGCYFRGNNISCSLIRPVIGECAGRNDEKSVVFKKIGNSDNVEKIMRCKEHVGKDESLSKEKPKDLIETLLDMDIRSFNVGNSDYSKHKIQTWDIWTEYQMNPFDADIAKRLNRKKAEPGLSMIESRIMDYTKIIHVCLERIRQLKQGYDPFDPTMK